MIFLLDVASKLIERTAAHFISGSLQRRDIGNTGLLLARWLFSWIAPNGRGPNNERQSPSLWVPGRHLALSASITSAGEWKLGARVELDPIDKQLHVGPASHQPLMHLRRGGKSCAGVEVHGGAEEKVDPAVAAKLSDAAALSLG